MPQPSSDKSGVGNLSQIEILGGLKPEDAQHPFRPHPNKQRQMAWRLPEAERRLTEA
jgi:hypothetical protein